MCKRIRFSAIVPFKKAHIFALSKSLQKYWTGVIFGHLITTFIDLKLSFLLFQRLFIQEKKNMWWITR